MTRSRLPLIVVMIAALLCAGLTRQFAVGFQQRGTPGGPTRSAPAGRALGSMNSFALALLLGGLRGPLVMILWATSEAQKADRDLEDFDTKVEWIRLLQPEFDTVHIFQIWNKAYNISVQMASLPNRYAAILDALDYARSVDESRPNNVNVLNAIAQVYSNKLGTMQQEKTFYRRRVRDETLPHKTAGAAKKGSAGWQRRQMDPVLDASGNVLPELLQPARPRPAGVSADSEWNDGSELQYLKQYEPFPYGVSPFALAYNYAKRGQVAMTVDLQKPLQLSDSVIDSRPALELKAWAEDDWERGRQFEMRALGMKPPLERLEMEAPTAAVPLDAKIEDPSAVPPALYSYKTAARIAREALAEYDRHLKNPSFFGKFQTYASHIDTLKGIEAMASADHDYLAAMTGPADRRDALTKSAADRYRDTIRVFELITLKYYTEDDVVRALYPGQTKQNVDKLPPEQLHDLMGKARKEFQKVGGSQEGYAEDRAEYEAYISRATARLEELE